MHLDANDLTPGTVPTPSPTSRADELGLLDRAVRNPRTWALLKRTVVRAGLTAFSRRQNFENRTRRLDTVAAVQTLAPDGRVLNGPFAGMRYPTFESCYGALFAKLLGSYERELHPWIEAADRRQHPVVVDIGCAEGYYAVGLARRWPGVVAHAFDIDPRARDLCRAMARANDVEDRVRVGAACDADALRALDLPEGSLVISDCEGYELELFSDDLVADLAAHDVLVELHDWFDVEISTTLKARFAATHDVEAAYSVDDLQKVHLYEYPELARWDAHDRRVLLTEHRPYVMEWIYCRARGARA